MAGINPAFSDHRPDIRRILPVDIQDQICHVFFDDGTFPHRLHDNPPMQATVPRIRRSRIAMVGISNH